LRNFLPLFLCTFFLSSFSIAQDSTSAFSFSGYADAYIAVYTDSLPAHSYQKFPTVSPRSKQFGLNIAQLSAKYSSDRLRGTIVLHYGDIPLSAWSPTFNFIQEANIGIRICKNLWLDGGFFRSNVGTEALLPKENIASSIAIPTYFEPYYEAGFRLNYTPTDKLALNLYLLNGYNLYEDNNPKKSIGLLVTYIINPYFSVGYDNYLGDDTPDEDTSATHLRFYNNLFANYEKNKLKIQAGIDIGIQQHSDFEDADKTASMFSGLVTVRYAVAKKVNVYGRFEYFTDPQAFLSGYVFDNNGSLSGLQMWGVTLGVEVKPTANSYVRLEGRDLVAKNGQDLFYWNGEFSNSRLEAMLNFGVWFP
jgi:hypothetical protein